MAWSSEFSQRDITNRTVHLPVGTVAVRVEGITAPDRTRQKTSEEGSTRSGAGAAQEMYQIRAGVLDGALGLARLLDALGLKIGSTAGNTHGTPGLKAGRARLNPAARLYRIA